MRYSTSNSVLGSRAKLKYFRTFYITIFLISAYAAFSIVTDRTSQYLQGPHYGVAQKRALAQLDVNRLMKRDEECRLVHHAEDKCAFIKANCPDEEAGLLSYLSLYYCSLPNAQPFAFTILVLWLALLFSTIGIAASDFFCINLSTIANILGMSESMAGVTFLAFGNGSPDVFSTFAAMSTNSGSLAVGELIGAAGFITAVVAGSMALVREFKVGKKTFVRDVGFFIVAASFSMVFLADGALHLWECCVMIGFYLFYVATVVTWHWYLQRRRKQRERSALERGQYVTPGNEEIEVREEDDDDEDAPAGERRGLIRDRSAEDFSALERGASPVFRMHRYSDDDSDEDSDQGRLLAAEMSNSMRVTRQRGARRNTMNPIRPSLVGALEFRSVLSNLQKSRSMHSKPIHLRRYSDDPNASSDRFQGPNSETAVTSEYDGSVIITGAEDSADNLQRGPSLRTRAVSMNDVGCTNLSDPAAFSVTPIPEIGVIAATPNFPQHLTVPNSVSPSAQGQNSKELINSQGVGVPPSPTFSVSPPPSNAESRNASLATASLSYRSDDRLAAPKDGFPGARHLRSDFFQPHNTHLGDSPTDSPRARASSRPHLIIPSSRDSSRGRSPHSQSPFPTFTDSPVPMSAYSSKAPSLLLPEANLSLESSNDIEVLDNSKPRPIRWWPYSVLPCPRILLAILFPTLCNWGEKRIWDKCLSIISAPSIFLLTVTLPVVEPESKDEDNDTAEDLDEPPQTLRRRSTVPRLTPISPYQDSHRELEWLQYRRSTQEYHLPKTSPSISRQHSGHHNAAELAVSSENMHHNPHLDPVNGNNDQSPAAADDKNSQKDWNRWLVAVQIFTAPLFVMLLVWANSSNDDLNLRHLLQLVLYSLLGSMTAFAILVLTTTAEKPPKYRFLFCFLGFIVSVSWISTIANEVVGVLKAFGVILGISDAILGLTIFAVGNSLGDLVADITVARLGFPVMALSACFGGPMLNILLGIGISGLYMTIKEGNHKHEKHPDRPMKYKPYQVEVSGTLIVSGVTLLVTLVGLLIVVPLNKWVMSRKIGWGLIILWSMGTIINLVVEITGVWGDAAILF